MNAPVGRSNKWIIINNEIIHIMNRLVLMVLAVVGIGVALYFVQSSSGGSLSNMSLEEKMGKADENLYKYNSKAKELLRDMESVQNDQEKVIKKLKKYNKLSMDNIHAFNRLQLPCPGSVAAQDPSMSQYKEWSRDFYARSKQAEEELRERLNRVLDAAGINRH